MKRNAEEGEDFGIVGITVCRWSNRCNKISLSFISLSLSNSDIISFAYNHEVRVRNINDNR